MKKLAVILTVGLLCFGMAACGNSSDQAEQASAENNSAESSITDETDTETEETQTQGTDTSDGQGSQILVAYFSATNTTESVAEHIANCIPGVSNLEQLTSGAV